MSRLSLQELIDYVLKCHNDLNTVTVPTQINIEEEIDLDVEKKNIILSKLDFNKNELLIIDKTNKPQLSDIFQTNKLFRIGVNYDHEKKNISIINSIFYSIKTDYHKLNFEEQFTYISRLFEKMRKEISGLTFSFVKAFISENNLLKSDINNDLNNCNISENVIKITASFFDLNIIVVDYNNDDVLVIPDSFDKYKKTIVILKYLNNYEPLVINNTHHFIDDVLIDNILKIKNITTHESNLDNYTKEIKRIINAKQIKAKPIIGYKVASEKEVLDNNKESEKVLDEKEVPDNKESEKIIENDDKKDLDDETLITEDEEVTNKDIFCKIKPKTIIDSKLKLVELQKMASDLNIDLKYTTGPKKDKVKTKTDLIEEINNKK